MTSLSSGHVSIKVSTPSHVSWDTDLRNAEEKEDGADDVAAEPNVTIFWTWMNQLMRSTPKVFWPTYPNSDPVG